MSMNASFFRDKQVEKMIVEVAEENKLTLADTRRIVRTYFEHIAKVITEAKFIDNETNNILLEGDFYIRVPHLFALKASKYKLKWIQKHNQVKNDKEPI